MDRVMFLGTGGGRWSSIFQSRATGGWRLEVGSDKIHIDPGPGAIVRCKECGVNPRSTTAIIVTHCHLDHYNDLPIMVEAMSMAKRSGKLFGSKSIVEGYNQFESPLDSYHRSLLSETAVLDDKKTYKINNITLRSFVLKHEDPTAVGVVFETRRGRIGYVSDTSYYEGLPKIFSGTDLLVINMMRPGNSRIKGHLCSEDAVKLLENSKPKKAIFQHFGLKMIRAGPENEVKNISEKTGIECLTAYDGMVCSLEPKQAKLK